MGMTDRKINEVLDRYEPRIAGILETSDDVLSISGIRRDQMEHALQMIPKMREFLKEGRREKTFRWLGFLQGVLYSNNVYTIEEMANHNRPTDEECQGPVVEEK